MSKSNAFESEMLAKIFTATALPWDAAPSAATASRRR